MRCMQWPLPEVDAAVSVGEADIAVFRVAAEPDLGRACAPGAGDSQQAPQGCVQLFSGCRGVMQALVISSQ